MSADDTRPHSRACGVRKHDHGLFCHSNCPTCGGRPATAAHTAATNERETLRWVVFCSMFPGEERLFGSKQTSEISNMNARARGVADAVWLAGFHLAATQRPDEHQHWATPSDQGEWCCPERAQRPDDREATLRETLASLPVWAVPPGYVGGNPDPTRQGAQHAVGAVRADDLSAALATTDGEVPPTPAATTRTEWRINGVDGEPSFAISQSAPEAEYWTRKVAAMDDDRWPECRTVTSYADHVTDWAPADGEATK